MKEIQLTSCLVSLVVRHVVTSKKITRFHFSSFKLITPNKIITLLASLGSVSRLFRSHIVDSLVFLFNRGYQLKVSNDFDLVIFPKILTLFENCSPYLSITCSSFSHLSQVPGHLIRSISLDFVPSNSLSFLHSLTNLTFLSVHNLDYPLVPLIKFDCKTPSCFSSLQRLSIVNSTINSIQFLIRMSNLEVLYIYDCSNLFDFIPIKYLKKLKCLDVLNCSEVADLSIVSSLSNSIRRLNISDCAKISDLNFINVLVYLKCFSACWCSSVHDISPLSNLKFLNYLDLSLCSSISNFSILSSLFNLKFLILSSQSFSDLSFLNGLSSLVHLDLSFCFEVFDISPLENLVNLQFLNLDECSGIQDFSVLSCLNYLVFLDLSCTEVSDLTFLKKLKFLRRLNLNMCDNIDISTLEAEICGLKYLKSVSLEGLCDAEFSNENFNELIKGRKRVESFY
ncbi:hypothetical protein RCL1_007921 [Eukaryota sp. TZLM3-RCL]